MTIVRIGELTAESAAAADCDINTTIIGSLPNSLTTNVHTGARAYGGSNVCAFGPYIPTPVSAYRLSYFFRNPGIGAGDMPALYEASNGNVRFESSSIWIRCNNTLERFELVRPATGTTDAWTTILTAPMPSSFLVLNTYMHISVTHKIHETDGFLVLRINGVKIIDYAGDTRPFGQGNGSNFFSDVAGHVRGAGSVANNQAFLSSVRLDDMYLDSIVGEPDSAPPPRRFGVRLITTAGANAQFTPLSSTNVSNVDELPPDGDTTRNTALAADLKDTFNFSSITVPADYFIVRQIPKVFCKRLDTGVDSRLRLHVYDGANYAHSADLELPADYSIPIRAGFDLDPDGNPWTETTVNNSQVGYESRGTFS